MHFKLTSWLKNFTFMVVGEMEETRNKAGRMEEGGMSRFLFQAKKGTRPGSFPTIKQGTRLKWEEISQKRRHGLVANFFPGPKGLQNKRPVRPVREGKE